jgi:hypothetical protein
MGADGAVDAARHHQSDGAALHKNGCVLAARALIASTKATAATKKAVKAAILAVRLFDPWEAERFSGAFIVF